MTQKDQNILETCMAATYDALVGNWTHIMGAMQAGVHKQVCLTMTLDIRDVPTGPVVMPQISYRTRAFSSAQTHRVVDIEQTEFRFTSGLVSDPAIHSRRTRHIATV